LVNKLPPSTIQRASIVLVGKIVPHPEHEHEHEPGHEPEGKIVVGVLAGHGQLGEGLRPQERQQEVPAIEHVEAGERQNDEAARAQPVGEALDAVETHDRLAAPSGLDADPASNQKKQRQQTHSDGENPDPGAGQRAVAPGPPVVAFGLDHDAGLPVWDRDLALETMAHRTPDFRVAQGAQMSARHVAGRGALLGHGAIVGLGQNIASQENQKPRDERHQDPI
jgi:hypothetical protein